VRGRRLDYRRIPPLDDVLTANLKWLAGYRHPRNASRPGLMAAVVEAFTRPRPLIEGTEAVGDPIEVLPTMPAKTPVMPKTPAAMAAMMAAHP
jgi:hypothetical protein